MATKEMEIGDVPVLIECEGGEIRVYDSTWYPFLQEIEG